MAPKYSNRTVLEASKRNRKHIHASVFLAPKEPWMDADDFDTWELCSGCGRYVPPSRYPHCERGSMNGREETQRLRKELTKITQQVLDTVDHFAETGTPNPTGIYESSLLLNFTAIGGEHYSATVTVRDHSAMREITSETD